MRRDVSVPSPRTELLFVGLAIVVVVPSLLLSLLSFLATHQQEEFIDVSARHRATVLLGEAEAAVKADLASLKSRLGAWATQVSFTDAREMTEPQLTAFQSAEPLVGDLFRLDVADEVSRSWLGGLPVGEVRYTAKGSRLRLAAHLQTGGYLVATVSLDVLRRQILSRLNNRLHQFGETAEAKLVNVATRFIGADRAQPLAARDKLRLRFIGAAHLSLAPPLGFWQLAVVAHRPPNWAAGTRNTLIRWSVVLGFGAFVAGLYWTWKRIEQQRALSQLKTDFLSNVSHELCTPLTSIRLYVEMLQLKRYLDESQAAEYFAVVIGEIERLHRVVRRLLDVSQIAAGRKSFTFVPGDLKAVVSETLLLFEAQLAIPCEIHTQLADDLPQVRFDRDGISEVLWNLLDNAVKYSGRRGPWSLPARVDVTLCAVDGDVRLTVADDGIGILRRERRRIFERFYRVDNPLSCRASGTGLGLAMIKHIVTEHGGTVSVASTPGKGSRFTVHLPLNSEMTMMEVQQ